MFIAFLICLVLWVLNPIFGVIGFGFLFAAVISKSVKKTVQRKTFWLSLVTMLLIGVMYLVYSAVA